MLLLFSYNNIFNEKQRDEMVICINNCAIVRPSIKDGREGVMAELVLTKREWAKISTGFVQIEQKL